MPRSTRAGRKLGTDKNMDEQMQREIARIMSGNRFCDRHPVFTMTCMLTIVVTVVITAVAALLIGLAGVLNLLEIRSIFDRFLDTWHWWGLIFTAVGLGVGSLVLMTCGIILHKRWI